MNKHVIGVPAGIRYISEWKEFRLFDFPYIIDKQITGCGFTEWVSSSSDEDEIAISPRVKLLENKAEQHKDSLDINSDLDYRVLYIKSDIDDNAIDYDKHLSSNNKGGKHVFGNSIISVVKEREKAKADAEKAKERAKIFREEVKAFWRSCQEDPAMGQKKKHCKILVTYDSFRKVKEALTEIGVFSQFRVVVDEFQSIFTDARFKATTEMEFVNQLKDVKKVVYVSATPMIDKYLDQMDELKDLPYLCLDWGMKEPSRITRPDIRSFPCTTMVSTACSLIDKYRNNNFYDRDCNVYREKLPDGTIRTIESKEAIFYFNSVKNICDIIKKAGLTQNETCVLCAGSKSNILKVRRAFKAGGDKSNPWSGPDKIPVFGEPRKMFTLCTRTVYLGADFYSDNARSFIFSDANIGCLAVDITLDLPQILGRQRLDSNPWKNSTTIYFNPIDGDNKLSKEAFDEIIKSKLKNTEYSVSLSHKADENELNVLSGYVEKSVKSENYMFNYAAVDHYDGKFPVVKENKLVRLSDLRYYEISQLDYADRCTVYSRLSEISSSPVNPVVDEVSKTVNSLSNFRDQLRYLCSMLSDRDDNTKRLILERIPDYIANYYVVLGPDRCLANSYVRIKLDKELNSLISKQQNLGDLDTAIYQKYKVGDRILLSELKRDLQVVFDSVGYKPKNKVRAVDIKEWFDVRGVYIYASNGKQTRGFELTKKLK